MKQNWKRLISVLLALAMLLTYAPMAVSAEEKTAASGVKLEFTQVDPATLDVPKLGDLAAAPEDEAEQPLYGDGELVRVSIELEAPATLEKQGWQTQGIAQNESAAAYREKLQAQQDALAQRISDEILGSQLDVKWNITLAGNVISANVPYGKLDAIRALSGVKSVELENLYEPMKTAAEPAQPEMTKARDMTGASGPNASQYTGAGQRIAVIDTGLDDEHQSFDADAFEYAISQVPGAAEQLLTQEQVLALWSQLNFGKSHANLSSQAYMNAKIPYHANYVDGNMTTNHTSDTQEEHGSHVCGISAANRYLKQGDEYVSAAETVGVVGEAPDAQIFVMKVFGSGGGAYDSDYMVAIEDAMILGADCVNLSLGSSAPGLTYQTNATYQNIMNNLANSDLVVSISMGNNTNWDTATANGLYADDVNYFTGGSPGSYTNAFTVASIDDTGKEAPYIRFGSTDVRYLEGGGAANNAPVTTVAGEYEFIYIDGPGVDDNNNVGRQGDQFLAAGRELVEGKIAICNRGTSSFFAKANAAVGQGAVATIIVNNQPGTISMALDGYSYTNPVVSVKQSEGEVIKAAASSTGTVGELTYYIGSIKIGSDTDLTPMAYYEMSSFSSWGVAGSLVLKPEITAPGGSVLSLNGYHRNASGGGYSGGHDEYELMSGTSMAAPQINGLSGAMGQYYRENDIAAKTGLSKRQFTQSLLMSTAVPVIEEGSNNYYSLLKQGAGLANLEGAVTAKSYILMDEAATSAAADGKVKAELGEDPDKTGTYSYSFTITNFSDAANAYSLRTDLFTQAIKTVGEEKHLDLLTRPMEAADSYVWTAPELTPVDVNGDGASDEADVQAILDKDVGTLPEGAEFNAEAADLNGDGEVTSYDAYLLLAQINALGDSAKDGEKLIIPGKSSATVTVTLQLSDAEKELLAAEGRKGAYVEGFTFVESDTDSTHSIPILAFYGSWTDPSMYDGVSYVDTIYGTQKKSYFNSSSNAGNTNNLYIRYNGSSNDTSFSGNPYIAEEQFPADRVSISGSASIYQLRYNLIRNAGSIGAAITDETGKVLFASNLSNNVTGAYYNTQANTPSWQSTSTRSVSVNRTPESLGLSEGDKLTAKVYALPEYYGMKLNGVNTGSVSAEQFVSLIEAGALGEGASFGYSFTVDNTAPTIDTDNTVLDAENNTLTVAVQDNRYIANIRIMDVSGKKTYFSVLPEQTEPGLAVSHTFELGEIELGNAINIFAADYAGNEVAMFVRLADGPIYVEKEVYVQTTVLEAGKQYLITNTMNPGTGYALGRNGTTVARDELTVNAANGSYETPFINGDDVNETSVWAVSGEYVFQNDGYYLRRGGSGWSQGLNIDVTDSNNVWTWDADNSRLYLAINGTNYYLRYSNNNFSLSNRSPGSVYLFEKIAYVEEFDPDKATEVVVTPATASMYTGSSLQLSAAVDPVTVPDKSVTWTSSDETLATVDDAGLVTALAAGSVTITAESVQTPGVTGAAVITIKQTNPLDAAVNAQIADGDGAKFVRLDLNNMSVETLGAAAGTHYGGGRSGSWIVGFVSNGDIVTTYVSDEGYDSEILGSFGTTQYNSRDGAHVPAFSAVVDEETITEEYASLFVSQSYLLLFSIEGSLTGWNASGYTAIAYEGTDVETGTHYYYMLNNNGQLLAASVGVDEQTPVEEGELNLVFSTSDAAAISGLSSQAGSFGANYMSMSVLKTDTLYGLLIANNNTKELFYVDLSAESLEAKLVGGLPNVSAFTTLYNDDGDVNVVPIEFDEEGVGARLRAEAKNAAARPAELKQSLASEAANAVTGGTNATRGGYVFDKPAGASEPEALYAVGVTADKAGATNGKYAVEFDTEALELLGVKLSDAADFSSVLAQEGKYSFAFVDLQGSLARDESIAEFIFRVKPGVTDAEIKVTTAELNDKKPGTDETVTVVAQPVYGAPVWTWTEQPLGASATFSALNSDDAQTLAAAITTAVKTEPGCTEAGELEATATVLFNGETYTDTISLPLAPLGHSYAAPVFNWAEDCSAASAVFSCAVCGETETVDAEISSETTEPGCTAAGQTVYTASVSFDGAAYADVKSVELAALGHSWNEGEITAAPSCTDEGVKTFSCAVCGETRTEAVSALGHTSEDVAAIAPSCTEAGQTAGKQCSVCGAILEGMELILPAGHTLELLPAVAATCVVAGQTAGVKCSVCGEILTAQQSVPAAGHVVESIPAVAATCTAPGKTAGAQCAVCGLILAEPQLIPAKGHTTELIQGVAATCVSAGLSNGYKCTVCDQIVTPQQLIPAAGHNWNAGEITEAPSCTAKGIQTYTCSVCGEKRLEAIDAAGHSSEDVAAIAATCTAPGQTAGKQCSVCGAILYGVELVPAKGHTIVSIPAVDATCTAGGKTEGAKCAVCNEIIVEQKDSAALGHSWNAGEITTAPTTKSAGEKTYTCERCGETKTEPVAKLSGLGLQLAITIADQLNTESCTEDSAAAFAAALEAAKKALEEAAAQTELDDAFEALLGAINGLEAKPIFEDVQDKEAYYFDAVYWAYNHDPQITKGTTDTLFSPDDTVNRGQAVTFLWRAAGEPKAKNANNPFTDVKESSYFYNAVLWAVEQGITNGTGATTFSPSNTCTKGHIITFIWRWQGQPAATMDNPFDDVQESSFYYKAALWAAENELVDEATGVTATRFNGGEDCSRAQTVTFLYRAQ